MLYFHTISEYFSSLACSDYTATFWIIRYMWYFYSHAANIFIRCFHLFLSTNCTYRRTHAITKRSRKDFEYWVSQFNFLQNTITVDSLIRWLLWINEPFYIKGENFTETGKFDSSILQKKKINIINILVYPSNKWHAQ